MRLEELGELRRRRAVQLAILLGDLGKALQATQPVRDLPEKSPDFSILDVRVGLSCRQRAALEHDNCSLGKARAVKSVCKLPYERRVGHERRVAKQVVGGEQGVGLAAAELGLKPIDAGCRHVAAEPSRQLPQKRKQAFREIGLVAEHDRIQVVGRTTAAGDEPQVSCEK